LAVDLQQLAAGRVNCQAMGSDRRSGTIKPLGAMHVMARGNRKGLFRDKRPANSSLVAGGNHGQAAALQIASVLRPITGHGLSQSRRCDARLQRMFGILASLTERSSAACST
jgi:hypothetical protein